MDINEEPKFKSKEEAIKDFSEFEGHEFLTSGYVKGLCKTLGVTPLIGRYQDNRSEFKGLYVDDPSVKEGDWVEGCGAKELAEFLCSSFAIEYQNFYGRGTQFRECTSKLKDKFGVK